MVLCFRLLFFFVLGCCSIAWVLEWGREVRGCVWCLFWFTEVFISCFLGDVVGSGWVSLDLVLVRVVGSLYVGL